MASADMTLRLLDMPEVQRLLEMLRELALTHCQGCDDDPKHRYTGMAADGFEQGFIDGLSTIHAPCSGREAAPVKGVNDTL